MEHRRTLLEEILLGGIKSPVTQKLLLDLSMALIPLLMIALA